MPSCPPTATGPYKYANADISLTVLGDFIWASKEAISSEVAVPSGTGRFLRDLDSIAWVSSTTWTSSAGRVSESIAMDSAPVSALAPLLLFETETLERAFRASSRSRDRRAMTRTAASFWYSAVDSSSLVRCSCSRRLKVSSAMASHSFWKVERRAGMDVRVGGRGRTTRAVFTGKRSSRVRSSLVIGSFPFSSIHFSIKRFSKTLPAATQYQNTKVKLTRLLMKKGHTGAFGDNRLLGRLAGDYSRWVSSCRELKSSTMEGSLLAHNILSVWICDAVVQLRLAHLLGI